MTRAVLLWMFLITAVSGRGWVVVIQPALTEQDYRSAATFQQALRPYLDEAMRDRTQGDPALAIFPEYIGAWLVAVDGPESVFRTRDLNRAMIRIILAHPFKFIAAFIKTYTRDHFSGPLMGHVERAIFQMQASTALKTYLDTFSSLAKEFQTWIVAGSILLPELEIGDGVHLKCGSRKLLNQSLVFNPLGDVVLIAPKTFPVSHELTFLDAAEPEDLPVVDTPLGRVGVLICADSWHPECYAALDAQGVDLLVVPSLVNQAERWLSVWGGYDPPSDDPGDVDPSDLDGNTQERDMWKKYALKGRMTATSARWGFNSFLIGDFWGLTGAGQSNIIQQGRIVQEIQDYHSDGVLTITLP